MMNLAKACRYRDI